MPKHLKYLHLTLQHGYLMASGSMPESWLERNQLTTQKVFSKKKFKYPFNKELLAVNV